jgi:hypothetical protein
MNMGIIAEDDSDVDVIKAVTLKLMKPHVVGFKKFVGNGCGKLRRKCGAWASNLVRQGCSFVIVVHDLDTYDHKSLWSQLNQAVLPARAKLHVVLLPKREIEAWLLYDSAAIAQAFNGKVAKLPGDPEALLDPKKYLRDLVWKKYRKDYLHTVHNDTIARFVDVSLLRRAGSFLPHVAFATEAKKKIK